MQNNGYNPKVAVSALKKLATLGNDHSFLSSHPAPGKRADRLKLQLEGKASSIEEQKQGLFNKFKKLLIVAYNTAKGIVQWIGSFF